MYSGVPEHLLCFVLGSLTQKRLEEYGVAVERIATAQGAVC
jgi:hypothetical protein